MPRTIHVFHDHVIHFTPGDSSKFDTGLVSASDNGRVITRTVDVGSRQPTGRIIARVATRPIPLDDQNVYDKWDRAANVRLSRPGTPDVEIVKFITAYGGATEHAVEVTHLAPLLEGACTFRGFVDTWMSPGWKMDLSLTFEPPSDPEASDGNPDWVLPVLYERSVTAELLDESAMSVEVEIPAGTERVVMHYLVSGHCTDGRGADEFESKDNVIRVDGAEVHRIRPWRDDCRRFRAINPYCRRWSDGSWSADYSRSGWCPGDHVPPREVDLSAQLPAGGHVIAFEVEGIRPRDAEGHFGYWRVSSYLLGWRR